MTITRIVTTIAIFQTLCQCLQLRQSHQMPNNAHQLFYAGQIFQTMQLLGLLVIVVGAGACCWYFRGCFNSQNRSNPSPPIRVYDDRPTYRSPPITYQSNNIQYPPSRSQPTEKNPILNYYQNQQPVARIKQSNPYVVTKKQSMFSEWDPIQSTSITSCGICSHFNKSNQIPMLQVQCMEDHCFHIPCISQYRAKVFLEQAGNGLNKCPKCKSNYSPIVKIHCPNCRNSIITVNLSQSCEKETGLIDTSSITKKYGDRCQNCRDY